MLCVIMHVVASLPTVKFTFAENNCILEGQNASLTCKASYNGTNLMPMTVRWYKYKYIRYPSGYHLNYVAIMNTVNASSVHQSTFTFVATGPITDIYGCRVGFLSPTGIVLPGVSKQRPSVYLGSIFTSPLFASRTIASEIVVYNYIIVDC